jgi:hypothetical protein
MAAIGETPSTFPKAPARRPTAALSGFPVSAAVMENEIGRSKNRVT